jgi:hypothetical protein
MASEFEQTKREVSGRSVVITSWHDPKTTGWLASAPDYAGIASPPRTAEMVNCKSRQAAIDMVVHTLAKHFAIKRAAAVDTVIFL